jgi:4-amino-4-deoxy-L-arabinose transferase-like glycosyltransferase
VTQTDTATIEPQTLSRPARLAWLLLILATLYICYFHNLGAIGLVGPDEPRYAWIARAMVESGDWVTPRLYGKPWFEKPILYYWGAAASFKLFGVSEVTARLPSAISALLATLALAWLALRLYGAETARWLLLLLPTTVGMIGFSHAAATDMPFAAMLTIAMVLAADLVGLVQVQKRAPSDSFTSFTSSTSFTSLLFGFFLGLAALAKGPAAIVLSAGAVLLWALFTKRWRDAFHCLHPIAVASFCLTALPWYILCARRNPDFFRVFIIEHNFKRYLTPEFQHIQPFWFYIPVLLLAVFPWTVLLIPLPTRLLGAYKTHCSDFAQTSFFLAWSLFTFLFFTVSKSKLPGYVLPAVPPLLILVTRALAEINERARRWLIFGVGASLFVAGLAFPFASERLPTYTDIRPAPLASQIGLVAVLAGLVIAVLSLLRRGKIALILTIPSILVLVVLTNGFLERADRGLTARNAFAEASGIWPDFHEDGAATWQLKRSLYYQLNFYAHKQLREWTSGEPKPQWLFVEPRFEQEVRAAGFACRDYLVFPAVMACKGTTSSGRP